MRQLHNHWLDFEGLAMLPKYKEIQDPLLAEIQRRGGSTRPSQKDGNELTVYEALAAYFELTNEDLNEKVYETSGAERPKWQNMVRWARNDLRKQGMLDGSKHGVWALSEKGMQLADSSKRDYAGQGTFLPGAEITPELLAELQRKAKEVGDLGELIVFEHEKISLRSAGRADLANSVEHVAQINTAVGFDIRSFSVDGREKLIEVKTTVGSSASFEITANEWAVAKKNRSVYWVYRVSKVESESPEIEKIQDPTGKVEEEFFMLIPTGYRVVPRED